MTQQAEFLLNELIKKYERNGRCASLTSKSIQKHITSSHKANFLQAVRELELAEDIFVRYGKGFDSHLPMKIELNIAHVDAIKKAINWVDVDETVPYECINVDAIHQIQLKRYQTELQLLNIYLKECSHLLMGEPITTRERAFEIWRNEHILDNVGFYNAVNNVLNGHIRKVLNIKPTDIFQYEIRTDNVKTVLILENNDIYHTIFTYLKRNNWTLGGQVFDMILFGKGNYVTSNDYIELFFAEHDIKPTYMSYCGDLDAKGIEIAIKAINQFNTNICLAEPNYYLYNKMIRLSKDINFYNNATYTTINEDVKNFILKFDDSGYLMELLNGGMRIPQEIITIKELV